MKLGNSLSFFKKYLIKIVVNNNILFIIVIEMGFKYRVFAHSLKWRLFLYSLFFSQKNTNNIIKQTNEQQINKWLNSISHWCTCVRRISVLVQDKYTNSNFRT
uniref:Uncharacterized protein n=1 Tax=Schizopora paradoxa TaxID=27342 RepID=A0A5B9RBE9_9AGAM|nr:hypothetical protein Schpa_000061 [Schizopora paradoxa]QEG57214.1 hypothetical protein Schpa_000061 [Schizopora paradoxa]